MKLPKQTRPVERKTYISENVAKNEKFSWKEALKTAKVALKDVWKSLF
ncbi:MAG: hypothetical protein AAF611_01510 [Bacteroidota bacterium]